ncbi:MAG: V0D/AC39 family V-type ATPase subunit [Anaerostipes sp.]|jgi:V/A-type H+-transporting ATPase subunit C|nr:V-type ATPase subunit [Anaerostipes sp.]
MSRLLKYSGIITKVRAMSARLLTYDDFVQIANLPAVTDFIDFLKNHPAYEKSFEPWDKYSLHRGDIEKVLVQSIYDDYTKLYLFGDIHIRKFLLFYMKWYEVELINYCFRIVLNHYEEPFDMHYKKPFFDRFSQLRLGDLAVSKNETELIENLKDTEYYDCMKTLLDTGKATLYDYNLALNLYYYKAVWKERKKCLKGKELDMYTKKCGANIDLLNIQWIYRSKKYYNMSEADLYSILIPIQYHIKQEQLKQFIEAPDLNMYLKLVGESYYGKKYPVDEEYTLERIYKECLEHLYLADFRSNPYSIATINRYLFQKEEEIEKLTTTLECIRYGIDSVETLKYVGGVAK